MFLKHSEQKVVKFNFGLGTNPNAVRHEILALRVHYFTFSILHTGFRFKGLFKINGSRLIYLIGLRS